LGWGERLERTLTYLFGWFTGLFFLLFERKNETVRFHARQSMTIFGLLSIAAFLVGLIGSLLSKIIIIGWLFGVVFGFLSSVLWWAIVILIVWMMLMAWFRPNYRFPFLDRWFRFLQ